MNTKDDNKEPLKFKKKSKCRAESLKVTLDAVLSNQKQEYEAENKKNYCKTKKL